MERLENADALAENLLKTTAVINGLWLDTGVNAESVFRSGDVSVIHHESVSPSDDMYHLLIFESVTRHVFPKKKQPHGN